MVDGCLDWQQHGLVRPDSVKDATETYFDEQDLFGQWVKDCCKTGHGHPFPWDLSSRLYESWKSYAVRAGEEAGSSKAFAQAMQKRGFERYREPNTGMRAFKYIRLIDHEEGDT